MQNTLFILLIILSVSCNTASDERSRKKALVVAESYVRGQLSSAEKEITPEGIITLSDARKEYVIDPEKIFTGLIDDDTDIDAIVSVTTFSGGYQVPSEHLIMISTDGRFTVQRSVESDMRVLMLTDRIIIAEVPTHPRTSPLFNCPECREIIRYKYSSGELVKAE